MRRTLAGPYWPINWRTALVVFGLLFAVYLGMLNPWIMSWGATDGEEAMTLPGDALHRNADIQVTRAITIDAPPETVWAWVIQMGQDRAGFYSYDWLENLFGADIHNTNRIVPEWQDPQIGDLMPLARLDYFGGRIEASRPQISIIEPNRSLVVVGFASFELIPAEGNATRLLVRDWQGAADAPLVQRTALRAYNAVIWDPAHFVMQRQMLRGIKARAEGNANPPAVASVTARAGWFLAAAVLAGLYVDSRREVWLVIPLVIVPPILLTTGDIDAALSGFLAIGITLLGALRFGRRWWPPYILIAAGVMLVLLLAPDAHIAFGLIFAALVLVALFTAAIDRVIPAIQHREHRRELA